MNKTRTLYLVRHAKSDWGHAELSDFDRPLNPRGRRDAPEMGRRLKALNVRPDLIICSPAKRARETMEGLDLPAGSMRVDPRIYEASVEDLLQIVHALDKTVGSAMLIGHNPAMSWLTDFLTGRSPGSMPTCAVASITIQKKHWKKAGAGCGTLTAFDYPKNTS